jgi:Xaa-Pro aminopeptidase
LPNLTCLRRPTLAAPVGDFRGNAELTAANHIRDLGLEEARIGIDERVLPLAAYEQLRALLPAAAFVPASDVVAELRMIKTAAELARIERAVRAVEQAYRRIAQQLRAGVTERQLTIEARDTMLAAGAGEVVFNFIATGNRAGIDNVAGADVPIEPGHVVKCDIGARFAGYCADLGRTFVCGDPVPAQARIFERIVATQARVLAAVRPGIRGADLFQIYLEDMQEGYGEVPWDIVGHGIGLEVHEIPGLSPLDHRPLQPGMVLCVEIGYEDPGRQGFHLEDMLLVTDDGYRPLSTLPKLWEDWNPER